jgi:hypothetical protein
LAEEMVFIIKVMIFMCIMTFEILENLTTKLLEIAFHRLYISKLSWEHALELALAH